MGKWYKYDGKRVKRKGYIGVYRREWLIFFWKGKIREVFIEVMRVELDFDIGNGFGR